MPVRVYLDSNDYSLLSDPRRITPELQSVKSRLIELANSGQVEFRYSSAHICELSPLETQFIDAAERRADLLVSLCGRRALVSFDELLRMEIEAVSQNAPRLKEVFSDTGDWFPPIDEIFSPISARANLRDSLKESIEELGLNRTQKRALEKKASRNGKLRPAAVNYCKTNQQDGIEEILKQYPMREKDAKVLGNYVLGLATAHEARRAFLESLRDPRWMIKWFSNHSEKLSAIHQWIREPSENLHKSLIDVYEKARILRELLLQQGYDKNAIQRFAAENKQQLQQDLLLRLTARVAELNEIQISQELTIEAIRAGAPGLTMFVTTGVDSMWNSINQNPRNESPLMQ